MEQNSLQNPTLKRQLNPMHVWAIAFGCIVGWGSFINPGKKFLPNSGVAGTAIAMALGALVMIIIAFSYAYMVPKYPKAGGEFTFAKQCFGKTTAYVCGWFLVAAYLTNVPMNSTAIGLIVDGLDGAADILKFGFHYQIAGFDVWMGEVLLASGILILFGTLNILGVKKAGIVQTVLASLLVLSVATLTISALFSSTVKIDNMPPWWGFDKSAAVEAATNGAYHSIDEFSHGGTMGIMSAILATFAIAPWAFVGFDTIPQAAEEFKFSYKKVTGIMVIAIFFGCFVYIANNTIVVGVAVSCAVLSGIMGFYLASSRLMYSMSREGYLPAVFGRVDKRFGTPKNAMIFCILISLSGPVLGREALGWFVDMSAIGASIGYFFTCAATLITIRRFKDGGVFLKIMAVVGVIFSLSFAVLQLVPIPGLEAVHFGKESYIMLVIWIVIGAVFYLFQRKKMQGNTK